MSVVRLRGAVDVVVGSSPDELADGALADEVIGLRAVIDRLEAQFARLAHAAHRRGVGAADGSPSTPAWLRRRTGVREGDARAALEAGAACGDVLHATGDAWRAGEISSGAARTIVAARVEGHDAELAAVEPVLLDLARDGATRELRRACAHFRHCATADGAEPRAQDGLTLSRTFGDRSVLTAELSEVAAETVVTAIHAFTDPPADGDDRTPARRRADALVRIAEVALATLPREAGRARTRATIVVDWTTLNGAAAGRLDGEFTGPIHPAEVDRALCDSAITRVVTGPGGLPLDVGRSRRTVPAAVRRALVVRDGGLPVPGLRPTPRLVRRASRRALAQWRPHRPGQPRAALRSPPPRRAPTRLDREARGPRPARAPPRRCRGHVITPRGHGGSGASGDRPRAQRGSSRCHARSAACTHRSSPSRRIHGLKHSYRSVKCTRVRPSPRSSSRVAPSARDHNGLPTAS